jgi:hypothetical protein
MLQSILEEFTLGKKLDFESFLPFPEHCHKGITAQKDLSRCKAENSNKVRESFGNHLASSQLHIVLLEALATIVATALRIDVHFLKCLIENFSEDQTHKCRTWIQMCYCTRTGLKNSGTTSSSTENDGSGAEALAASMKISGTRAFPFCTARLK